MENENGGGRPCALSFDGDGGRVRAVHVSRLARDALDLPLRLDPAAPLRCRVFSPSRIEGFLSRPAAERLLDGLPVTVLRDLPHGTLACAAGPSRSSGVSGVP